MLRHAPRNSADPDVLIGLDTPDDAGVYRLSDELALVQTVDFFSPIVDDPFDWGRIAAVNALSDVYAMGGRPVTALNLVGWPRSLDFELLGRVIEGGAAACHEAGVSVIGGHSIDDPEPKFGLAVTGFVDPTRIVTTFGARPGSNLVLTKPLGTGIISTAIKGGEADPDLVRRAVEVMTRPNRAASETMLDVGVEAATDVTGFGLLGHLKEMLGDQLSAILQASAIPIIPGTLELARRGILPGGSRRNIDAISPFVSEAGLDEATRSILFDAQTSGGLLIAVAPERTESLVGAIEGAAVIGLVEDGDGGIEVRP